MNDSITYVMLRADFSDRSQTPFPHRPIQLGCVKELWHFLEDPAEAPWNCCSAHAWRGQRVERSAHRSFDLQLCAYDAPRPERQLVFRGELYPSTDPAPTATDSVWQRVPPTQRLGDRDPARAKVENAIGSPGPGSWAPTAMDRSTAMCFRASIPPKDHSRRPNLLGAPGTSFIA
ncbi:hypothetical protein LLS1_31690 [Leifsonia sp. LS1]|nr:hypothetical protein LLS1_31690 [Leifsonia sp. LS1]